LELPDPVAGLPHVDGHFRLGESAGTEGVGKLLVRKATQQVSHPPGVLDLDAIENMIG
jgi:hypothetical protein